MPSSQPVYDLVIVGAGPAGAAAAVRARQLGRSCIVVEPGPWPPPHGPLEWLGPAGIAMADKCTLGAKAVRANYFTGLRLHSWDLKRTVKADEPDLRGWIFDASDFAQALLGLAQQAGADVLLGAQTSDLHLGEQEVCLKLSNHREARGRVLLVGDGLGSRTTELARLATVRESDGLSAYAEVLFDAPAGQTSLDVVIGASRSLQTVVVTRAGRRGCVRLVSHEPGAPVERQLRDFVAVACESRLIPNQPDGEVKVGFIAAGAALEFETLVGKRCLQIGETGGFIAAFSGERIYPCMRSGWMAAEAADRALKAPVLQDELHSFGSAWRRDLADYLRLPNTDLALLMPLVFNNAQMSGRLARAFLLGQTF
jgi:flavin-dependent dehydrogenase